MRAYANSFIACCGNGLPDEVYIDFKSLVFIEPAGITFLSNFVYWLASRSVKSYFVNHDRPSAPLRFLDDSLFFEQHTGIKVNLAAAPRSTTKHLQRVEHSNSHSWVRFELVPWLIYQTGKPEASFHSIQVCVSELFNNIQDHTDKPNGSIFLQHFPKKKTINISIADFGIGIPERVRTVSADLNDNQAIVQAVMLGFTTKTTPRNRGAGLDYLMQTVVATNGGNVRIFSLGGYVLFHPVEGGIGHAIYNSSGFCPGTTIEITIRTDTIVSVEDALEDLSW